MIKNLATGMKLTIIWIDSMMAMSHRKEIEIISVCDPERRGYQNEELRVGTFKERKKRNTFHLDVRPGTLVFEGWDLPFKTDTEVAGTFGGPSIMRGNACYNLVGDPQTIKRFMEAQLNDEIDDRDLASVILCDGHNEKLLYPEKETMHAVIRRMKEVAV